MGGRVALEIYRVAPNRVNRIALLNTGYLPLAAGPAGEEETRKRGELVELAKSQGMRAMLRQWLPPMIDSRRINDSALVNAIIDMMSRKTPEIFAAQVRALLARPDASVVLQQIRCPALLLTGREDGWSGPAQHQAMASEIRRQRVGDRTRLRPYVNDGTPCRSQRRASLVALYLLSMESRRAHLMKLAALAAAPLSAQTAEELFRRNIGSRDQFNKQFPPHKVIGNIHYVGSESLASFLFVTPQGNILLNSCFEATVPVIRNSVEKLGFKFTDIKILLGSHAHADHMEGDALVKELTGAQVMAMAEDVPALMKITPGGKPHPLDRTLHDDDEVKLGGTTLVAHLTAGHTRGCTTWTTKAQEDGETYDVVIIGSVGVNPGYILVNNKDVPGIAGEYQHSFKLLRLSAVRCPARLASFHVQSGRQISEARQRPESVYRSRRLQTRAGYPGARVSGSAG